uniref:U24-ctenitoxin-Pn1a n=1 Tax=Parasteatoda tepidariorum TaxID=114398 RepID=A0A2L2YL93_PARTP
MKLIPKCKDKGDYEELQCYNDSKFCVCYDKKGHPASPILSKLTDCGCFLERKRKIDSNPGGAAAAAAAAEAGSSPVYLSLGCSFVHVVFFFGVLVLCVY